MFTPTTPPTLEQLINVQITTHIPAFETGAREREIGRLQALHVAKRTELEAFERIFIETEPDIVLRGHAGQKLVFRLPFALGAVKLALRECLEEALSTLEVQILEAQLHLQEAAQANPTREGGEFAPFILAQCQPMPPQATAQPTGSPTMEVAGPPAGSLPTAA